MTCSTLTPLSINYDGPSQRQRLIGTTAGTHGHLIILYRAPKRKRTKPLPATGTLHDPTRAQPLVRALHLVE